MRVSALEKRKDHVSAIICLIKQRDEMRILFDALC